MISLEYSEKKCVVVVSAVCHVDQPIDQLHNSIAISPTLPELLACCFPPLSLLKGRQQVFQVTHIGQIVELIPADQHVQSVFLVQPCEISPVHVPQLLHLGSHILPELVPLKGSHHFVDIVHLLVDEILSLGGESTLQQLGLIVDIGGMYFLVGGIPLCEPCPSVLVQ